MTDHLSAFTSILDAMKAPEFVRVFPSNVCGSTVETVILQLCHLCTLRSKAQFITGILACVSALTKGAFGDLIHKYIREFNELCAEDRGTFAEQSAGEVAGEKVRIGFGDLLDQWSSLRNSAVGQKVRSIFALSICGAIGGTELAERYPKMYHRAVGSVDTARLDAWDIFGEILETTRVVWDTIAQCIVEGSISPLLGRDKQLNAVEKEYAFLKANFEWFNLGSLERVTAESGQVVTDCDYMTRLDKLTTTVTTLHKRSRNPPERLTLSKYQQVLVDLQMRVREKRTRGSIRAEPFTIKLDGTTAVGKTAITLKILRDILKVAQFPHSDLHMACIEPSSKFWDTVTNLTQGIYMDDVGNTMPDYQSFNELETIIRIKNTAYTPVNKASVEEKGTTFLDVKALVISSNKENLHADVMSCEPSSILRRMMYHILVEVAPGYELPPTERGIRDLPMLNPAALTEGTATQCQRFTIRKYVPLARNKAEKPDSDPGRFVVLEKGLTYGELMRWLRPKIIEHFARQKQFMADMVEDENAPLCQHGYTTASHCHDCIHALSEPSEQPLVENAGDGDDGDLPPELPRLSGVDRITEFFVPTRPIPRRVFFTTDSETSTDDEFPRRRARNATTPPPSPVEETPFQVSLRAGPPPGPSWVRRQWTRYWKVPDVVPTAPRAVRMCRAAARGRFDLEDFFLSSPARFLTAIYGVLPLGALMTTQGCFWLCGLASWAMAPSLVIMFLTAHSVSHQTVQYVRGRVAGMTLSQLALRMRALASRQLGVTLCALMAAITVAAIVHRTRRPQRRAAAAAKAWGMTMPLHCSPTEFDVKLAPKTGKTAMRIIARDLDDEAYAMFLAQQVDDLTCEVQMLRSVQVDAENRQTIAAREAEVAVLKQELQVFRSGLVEHGGCNSLPSQDFLEPQPAAPDPTSRDYYHPRREIATFNRLPHRMKTMTYEHALAKIARQLFVVEFEYESRSVKSNALMICTNHAILPAHNFVRSDQEWSAIKRITFSRTSLGRGPHFNVKFGPSMVTRLPGDLMLLQTNAGGTMEDLTPYLVEQTPTDRLPATELRCDLETYETKYCNFVTSATVVTSPKYGWTYTAFAHDRREPTFVGLCGAVVIAPTKIPVIIGFHSMGTGNTGVACVVTQDEVMAGLEVLRNTGLVRSPVISMEHTALHTPPGMDSLTSMSELKAKSILRTVPPGALIEPLGTLDNYAQARPKSRLGVSPISKLIEQKCGEVRKHGPPQNIGRTTVDINKWQELEGLSQLDPTVLSLAQQDQKDELVALVVGCGLQKYMRKLTELEACAGIPASHTVRRINMGTAAGFPRTGPKRELFEPFPTEQQPEAIVMTDVLRREVDELREKFVAGRRGNCVFKSSHKDEATKLTKTKVRVFEGAPVALTFLFRQYFMPILRVLRLMGFQSESGVGINATGSDWHKLFEHLRSYNKLKAIVGDWKHYDTSLAYQEMMAQFTIWIEVCKEHGEFTEDDIMVMWVIAEEISRHYAMTKGDVAILEGTNPSGNAGTVNLNNGGNGGRFRSAFYAMAPAELPEVPLMALEGVCLGGASVDFNARADFKPLRAGIKGRFADYVRCIFYGDDFICVARPEITSWFNQQTLAAWFASQGKVLTAADKGEFTSPLTDWEDTTFLKRGVRHDPYTGAWMAPLELDSIYKSLHVWPLQTPVTPKAHAAEVLSGAIRELLQHGEEVFNARVPQLLEVAEIFGARDFMPSVDYTYAAFASEWLMEHGEEVHGVFC